MAFSLFSRLKYANNKWKWNLTDTVKGWDVTTVTNTENESFYVIRSNTVTTDASISLTETMRQPVTMATTAVKSNLISELGVDTERTYEHEHHYIMIAILMSIFMCISLSIAVAIFVFCRKKNSVFMLQKCEQDSDLEMNDINTEVNTSDSDADTFDSEYEMIECSSSGSTKRRKLSKSKSSPLEFPSHYDQNNVSLALSSSFPDLTKYSTENQNVKTAAKEKHLVRKKRKERKKSKKKLKVDEKPSENSSVPLLIGSFQTGSDKCSRGIQTCRKITSHSLSMPSIAEYIPEASKTSMGTHSNNLSSSNNSGRNQNHSLTDSQTRKNYPQEHFYCIVEINEPKVRRKAPKDDNCSTYFDA